MRSRRLGGVAVLVVSALACGEQAGDREDLASGLPGYERAVAAGTAEALRTFVASHPDSAQTEEANAVLARLGPELEGFESVFPSEVAYVCHVESGAERTPIPSDVIAYVARTGAVITWDAIAETFVYDAPFAMRPAPDGGGPIRLGQNAAGMSVRTGKRCINGVQYEGDTVNVPDGLKFAPGGTLAGPRR